MSRQGKQNNNGKVKQLITIMYFKGEKKRGKKTFNTNNKTVNTSYIKVS